MPAGSKLSRLADSLHFVSFAVLLALCLANCSTAWAQDEAEEPRDGSEFYQNDDEEMLLVTQATQIKLGSQVLANAPVDARLWTLEIREVGGNTWHHVLVPGTNQYGWVLDDHVTSLNGYLYDQLFEQVEKDSRQNPELMEIAEEIDRLIDRYDAKWMDGKYNAAIRLAREAEAACRRLYNGHHILHAWILSDLADIYVEAGYAHEAILAMRAGEKLQEVFEGKNNPSTAYTQQGLADLLGEVGNYAEAAEYYGKAADTAAHYFGPNVERSNYSRALQADCLLWLGRLEESAKIFSELIRKETAAGRPESTTVGYSNWGLGMIAMYGNKDADEALRRFQLALKVSLAIDGERTIDHARILGCISWANAGLNNLELAKEQLVEALAIYEEADGPNSATGALFASDLGWLHFYQHDYEQAVQVLKKSVETTSGHYGASHFNTTEARATLGASLFAGGRVTEALEELMHVRKIIRHHVYNVLADQSPREQMKFIRFNDQESLHGSLSLAMKNQSAEVLEHTATWVLNAKGVSYDAVAAHGQLKRSLNTPEQLQLFDQWVVNRRQIVAQPNNIYKKSKQSQNDAEIAALLARQQEIEVALGPDFQQQLRARSGDWVQLENVRAKLKDDEVLVELFKLNPFNFQASVDSAKFPEPAHMVAWIVPKHGELQFIDLGNAAEIENLQSELSKQLSASVKNILNQGDKLAEGSFREAMLPLKQRIWDPLAAALGDAERLVISPDASLWLFPWSAIPTENGKYLIEQYSIRFVNSGRDLVRLAPQVKVGAPLVMADPAFNANPPALARVDQNRSLAKLPILEQLPQVGRLPGTAREVAAIQSNLAKFAGTKPQILLGADALETTFKQVRRPKAVVLSTHGFFLDPPESAPLESRLQALFQSSGSAQTKSDESYNPLLHCGVLLAGCNQRPDQTQFDDGILTGAEIVETDLQGTELVVLSACETGVGQIQSGEGVAGLRQAFQLAGASNVVATLWQIPDLQTARLMNDFFENLAADTDVAEALRQAQISRIESRRERFGAAHPFFWAAFTATGSDGEPMD